VPALGITGGIATGKSAFSQALLQHLPAEFFDADRCAHEVLATDERVHAQVREVFGEHVFAVDGIPDRGRLRERVFYDENARRQLEAILHPVIRERWSALAAAAKSSKNWLCFDIPLLYETKVEAHFDRVIVVACSPATQRQRLCAVRGLSAQLAASMMAAQLDLGEKISRAHHLIWNDSTFASLERQTELLAGWLQQRYG
jgi:dephospho-CoA kinase